MYSSDFKLPKLVGKRPCSNFPKLPGANSGKSYGKSYGCRLPPITDSSSLVKTKSDSSRIDWLYKKISLSSSDFSFTFSDSDHSDDDDFWDVPMLKLPAKNISHGDNSAVNIDSIPLPDPTPFLNRCEDKGGFAIRAKNMKPPTTATKPAEHGHKSISKDLPTINEMKFDFDSTIGLSKFLVIMSDGKIVSIINKNYYVFINFYNPYSF